MRQSRSEYDKCFEDMRRQMKDELCRAFQHARHRYVGLSVGFIDDAAPLGLAEDYANGGLCVTAEFNPLIAEEMVTFLNGNPDQGGLCKWMARKLDEWEQKGKGDNFLRNLSLGYIAQAPQGIHLY